MGHAARVLRLSCASCQGLHTVPQTAGLLCVSLLGWLDFLQLLCACVFLRWHCCLLLTPGACWPLSLARACVVHRVQAAVLLSAQVLLDCFRRRPGGLFTRKVRYAPCRCCSHCGL